MSSLLSASTASLSSVSLSSVSTGTMTSSDRARAIEAMKSMYQAAQQAEYLHLQAEAEILFQQLQNLQQRRVPVSVGSSASGISPELH